MADQGKFSEDEQKGEPAGAGVTVLRMGVVREGSVGAAASCQGGGREGLALLWEKPGGQQGRSQGEEQKGV